MARTSSLSGFTEWLPEERLVELHVLDTLREVFERHGFASIESRAVETIDTLLQKGEIDKEIYAVARLQEESGREARLALHFDLTVPFARYVVENAGHLDFPFRRYQIQKVWRGERPQDGRYREFTQADIDLVGDGALPFRSDVEIGVVMAKALEALPIGDFMLRVNNRKLSEGFYRSIGLHDTTAVLRAIDKLEKIGAEKVREELVSSGAATQEQAQQALELAQIRATDTTFVAAVRELLGSKAPDELLEAGLSELEEVVAELNKRVPGRVTADLSIARGLDYYTGTVYETVLIGHESLGSICSGGRYESLAAKGSRTFPGVGLSIGVTRLISRILAEGGIRASRKVPAAVFVALRSDADWGAAQDVADALRARGINVEVALKAEKFGKQIRHADRRGIPYVWFTEEEGTHEVKDIRTGAQTPADPASWTPPAQDALPRIVESATD
ncbi:histidine--tRNA ligase [Nesterenkonia aurantiaca]|uniref:Histidine--tRNA ligase n=1 Tax=Nesterenkonia aurantiaca TaxID=1436010 RepID=A0A4R7FXI7_9MICC|nr:histidine--tRNA ligase [Nesterenkonia aurantiaca]TDS83416.1 histidyl-tRNA synthetase [Nesterenkonia aurantiaca]